MRVIASLGLLTMLCGCGPIVYQAQQQMRGFRRTGAPNENPEVLTHSLLLSATHYTP